MDSRSFPRRWLPSLGAILTVMVALTGFPFPALAHEGPEHEIEEITQQIEATGPTADLLVDRAIEYVLIGKNADALSDLERALTLEPANVAALRELSRVLVATGETQRARAVLDRALGTDVLSPFERGELLIQRAELLKSLDQTRGALADCEAALRLHRLNPEWYLLRSELQRRTGNHRRRIGGLEEGLRETGAVILALERIEALLDAGRYREALALIEPELAASRLKARWLVRRGRTLVGLHRADEGRADLETALREIEPLLLAARPDLSLLLDQAIAQVLLGRREAAQRCLDVARGKTGHPEVAARIEEWLASSRRKEARTPR